VSATAHSRKLSDAQAQRGPWRRFVNVSQIPALIRSPPLGEYGS